MFWKRLLADILALLAVAGGVCAVAVEAPKTPPESARNAFQPKLDYAFTIEVELEPATYLGDSPAGAERVAVYIRKGTISGPMLHGTVIPMSGGDWARKRPDGTLDFDARYMLKLDDGAVVYMQNTGYRWASAEAMAKMSRREAVPFSDYYMRVTPRFEVRTGPHDWLTRYVFVGVAEKIPTGNRIHYFIVR